MLFRSIGLRVYVYSGGSIDTIYLIDYLTFGASVLHPSMR